MSGHTIKTQIRLIGLHHLLFDLIASVEATAPKQT